MLCHFNVGNFMLTRSSITSPGEFLESDFSKFDRSRLLHLLFRALARFEVWRLLCPKTIYFLIILYPPPPYYPTSFHPRTSSQEKNGKLPAPCNSVHAASVITYAREIMDDLPQDQRVGSQSFMYSSLDHSIYSPD